MQFRIYDRQTLAYKDGGYVASYTIDDDYIVNNNSTVKFVKELNDSVVVGDTIALIETSGAYHKGTITNFDNADFTITYKSDKELFNDNFPNPYASDFAQDENLEIAGRFGLTEVANILNMYFGNANDWARELPLKIITDGEVLDDNNQVAMLWNWSNVSINVVDWLVSLFERYNVSLSWVIDFNIANPITVELDSNGKIKTENGEIDGKIIINNNRNPFYVVTLSAVTNSGKIIKDNVANLTITYTERELPEATVCVIIDKATKNVVMLGSGTKNLLNPNIGKENKALSLNGYGGSEVDDNSSNISGFIRIEAGQKYTLSFNEYDGKDRYIFFYDKDKNALLANYGILSNNETQGRIHKTWTIPTTISYQSENKEPAYIRICYYNQSTEIQLEKGNTYSAYEPYNVPAIYYLINVEGVDMITLDGKNKRRVFPVKTKFVEYDTEGEETTEEQTASDTLIPSKFNQAIEIKISADSKMFDFANAMFGDLYKIINEQGTINSNYTGRKEESGNKWVTLYFGLGRQNYTDLIQKRFRNAKYQVVYNQTE